DAHAARSARELLAMSPAVLDGVGEATAALLAAEFGVETVDQLARFAPYREAETLVGQVAEWFHEEPSAPDDLVPRAVGNVVSVTRYSSFAGDRVLSSPTLVVTAASKPADTVDPRLLAAFVRP